MTAPNNISESPSPDSPSPEKIGDAAAPEVAPKKIGRPKGQPKTGGRKKPGPEPSGREARRFLEQNSGYLDLL